MNKNRVLLINTQFVEYYVSGFTNRFIGLWCYLQNKGQTHGNEIHWLTNKSLWNRYFKEKRQPSEVTIISADLRFFKYTSRLFYPLFILYIYYRRRCTSVHVATSIINSLYLVKIFNLFKIPYCFTFASNSLEMASYNNDRMKRWWQRLFSKAKNIEVLNPTNSIDNYGGNKFVSPTSFPYITQFHNIPEQRLTNSKRFNHIVFCGTFVPQKNPMLALLGFECYLEKCVNRPDDVKLKMIGKGELLAKVDEEIQRINNRYKREFVELVPESELIETLSTSKIFLSLQDFDNYPSQSLMEAMLFCNSVIATDYGDTSRLVHTSKNNILISEKDPAMLGKAIEMLISDWQVNEANKNLIDEQFSARVFADYFFQLHQRIASES